MWSRGRGRGRGMPRGGNWGPRGGGGNRGRGNFHRGGRGRGFYDSNFKKSDAKPYRKENFSPKRPKEIVEKLHEIDVGVTEYISNLEGFTGVLKSRYSDFHVNEIDTDGQEAKLTDLKVPRDPTPEREEEDDDLLVNRYRMEQLPIETWDRIHKMVQTKNRNEVVEVDVTTMTKDDRTKIHEAVKTVFGQKIVGSTVTRDNKKYVVIKLFNKNERIDTREKWPKSREGEYVYFLVYKEYTDTIEANIQISECLQMRPSYFNYAGVKDRRAKTTQWFCVRKIDPRRIADSTRFLKNIKIGNYCYNERVLKLGQLKGNRFRIALRNVTAENEALEKSLDSLKETGFINYYGLQRFGNCKEVPTHDIGLQLLRGNWRGAVELILKPRKHEQDRDIGMAKQIYEDTGDVNQAYEVLGKKRNRCIEGKLLGGLVKHSPNDFVNSLENVPRNMRLLYIHAYQSLIWNKIVSRRIKELGMKPIPGDLVVEGQIEEILPFLEANEEVSLNNVEHINAMERAIQEKGTLPPKLKVKFLTESDLESYTINDIVLPLPGYDVIYPNNEVRQWYETMLTDDGLSLEMPKQRVKTYTLSGAYRKVLERVDNFSWKIMGYNELTANLIRSDYEELSGKPEPEDIPDAKYKALILDFCLPPSCYATMAIREVMKMDTSVETHMNLDKTTAAEAQVQSDKSTQTTPGSSSSTENQEKTNTDNADNTNTENAENTNTENTENTDNGNSSNENMDTEVDAPTINKEKEMEVKPDIVQEERSKSENGNENSTNETADNQETSDKMDEASSPTCDKRKLPDESETECKKIKTDKNLQAFI